MSLKKFNPSNPYLSMLVTAWRYAGKERRRYVLIYSMFLFSNLLDASIPIIWGLFINDIQQNGWRVLQSAWLYAGAYVLIKLLGWCFHGPARVMERQLAFNISRNYLHETYHKALHLPVRWHQEHHSGATINRIRKAYEAIMGFFEGGFEYLHTFFKFAFSFLAMIYFAPVFGLVATALGTLVVFIILKFDKPYIRTLNEVNEKEHIVSSTLFDSLSNIVTVITLRLEKRMESGLLRKVADVLPPFRRNVMINEWKWFIVDILVAVIYGVILAGYVWQNWAPGEVFLIGGLVTLMGYVERFTSVFHNIAYQYTNIVRYNTDVTTAHIIQEAYEQHHIPDTANSLPVRWKFIEIANLNFSHRHEPAENGTSGKIFVQGLTNLHLCIGRGQRIALIGESGSGKSTLLALLRGLYQPQPEVMLKADGETVEDFGAIAGHVTLFPQEPEIFENTIEYNITLGLPFGQAELDAVCRIACFSEVVEQLPSGFQSSIQEKGVNLSGGQKQRLALARGIFAAKDSDILLLDEPTSSVDPVTESKIYERLFTAYADKAVVSALHRLHLLPRFDYIYLMENGAIVDEGTFAYLSKHSVRFREMWAHQEEAGLS
jgi:ATP-binding cassette, subfamily B, bacterial